MIKVMVFGTFDGLHDGHISFLKQAKEHGNHLIVSIARDSFVRSYKMKTPKNDENTRMKEILENGIVDEAILSDEVAGTYTSLEKISPDVVCFGWDQHALRDNFTEWQKNSGHQHIKTVTLDKYERM